MNAPTTVRRRDIIVTEEREEDDRYPHEAPTFTTYWTAGLRGSLSTGEYVGIDRTGNSFTEALASLEAAIKENGWEIR